MGTYDEKVIKSIQQKINESDFNSVPLGAEQRYISALRNSGINNLEEQYIIGTNTITTSTVNSSGKKIIVKDFYKDNSNNYYRLTSELIPFDILTNDDYKVYNKTFSSVGTRAGETVEHTKISEATYICKNNGSASNMYEFKVEGNTLKIYPINVTPFMTEKLEYIKPSDSGETKTLVATKETSQRVGIDNSVITKEKVTNSLI